MPPRRSIKVENINLGYRLNHLLNRATPLRHDDDARAGLILPSSDKAGDEKIGSGIVVIMGDPGSGKSTLGLQIAVAAAEQGCDSAYISLEEDPPRIRNKAAIFHWDEHFCLATQLTAFGPNLGRSSPPVETAGPGRLGRLLRNCRGTKSNQGKILLPGLLPRPLANNESRLAGFFWDQYRQIEFLVLSAAAHNRVTKKNNDPTGIRLVVIDSLNMLGIQPGNREMFYRLFDLFRRNHILGVFTAEPGDDIAFDSTMGDVIFKFSKERDAGYEVTFLECAKSRFYKRTLGRQTYKIVAPEGDGRVPIPNGDVGVVVFPSLHAIVAATHSKKRGESGKKAGFPFGWGDAITTHLLRSSLHRGDVVALAGPTGTFKTQIALNFLVNGVAREESESVLYLRLRAYEPLDLSADSGSMMPFAEPVCSQSILEHQSGSRKTRAPSDGAPVHKEEVQEQERVRREKEARWKVRTLVDSLPGRDEQKLGERFQRTGSANKYTPKVYARKGATPKDGWLIVADFPTGMLQPEEFVDAVWLILERHKDRDTGKTKIKRVVLDDVGSIGSSYPLLKSSISAGDHFLSYFLHVMRNVGLDVLLVGTTGDLAEANQMVNQACSLADAVLRTSIGTVFGDKYVLISGDGMAARQPNQGDTSPVVLLPDQSPNRQDDGSAEPVRRRSYLRPDARLLDEFVGFDSGQIQRPGIVLHLFEENSIQKRYNQGVLQRLQDRYGKPAERWDAQSTGVRLLPFTPGSPGRLAASLPDVPECPRDHTAIRMIDEFEIDTKHVRKQTEFVRNVLLLAYRSDVAGIAAVAESGRWSELYERCRGIQEAGASAGNRLFAFDRLATETLACLVLEGMATGGGIDWRKLKGDGIEVPTKFSSEIAASVARELVALHQLMTLSLRSDEAPPRSNRKNSRKLLPENACIYVCWYSQLRELFTRVPGLAQKLKICALPGGGFRGDWYLRVEPGSVSMLCGHNIVQSLCSTSENFERFREGVGIPVKGPLDTEALLAWPGAPKDLKIGEVTAIWEHAHRRSQIKGYDRFNRVLYGIGETLAGERQCTPEEDIFDLVYFKDLVRRLPSLIQAVCTEPGAESETSQAVSGKP
jgi:RecA/RadA recombinase